GIFEQVLLVCHEEGLLGNELFAIDGCKMPSNAAKEWSGTLDELSQKRAKIQRQIKCCLKEHKKLDKRNADDKERAERLAKSADTLGQAFDKIDKFLKTASPRAGFCSCKTCISHIHVGHGAREKAERSKE